MAYHSKLQTQNPVSGFVRPSIGYRVSVLNLTKNGLFDILLFRMQKKQADLERYGIELLSYSLIYSRP